MGKKIRITFLLSVLIVLFTGYPAFAQGIFNDTELSANLNQDAASAENPGEAALEPSIRNETPFTLGPEDIIEISVWGNPDLTTEMPIRPDGMMSFPLIGDLMAKGLTPPQLKEKITTKLRNYITDANVTVIVKAIHSIKISIAGEVIEPGTYEVNRPITLLHAFSLGKGFTEKAGLLKSYILRNGKKMNIDFYALVKEDDFGQNIWLQANDFIYIHDNIENRVNIMGEVVKPQVISFQEGMTVLDAVLMAEGLTGTAKPKLTKIYRRYDRADEKSRIEKIQIELDKVIFDGDLSKNIRLKPGDIIHIPRSFF
jgi:polysaccharide export outer membrane protein